MYDLKLAYKFSMISLNAQDSLHMTVAKRVALRCMAAAVILETYLDNGFIETNDKLSLKSDSVIYDEPYREAVFKPITNENLSKNANLKWWIKKASRLPIRIITKFERMMVNLLKEKNLLEEIPSLLGCDVYFVTSGVTMKEYRSNTQEYTAIAENIRAEILEDGPVTDEIICLIWLLRESGCMHDFFSRNELEMVSLKMDELYRSSRLANALFQIHIYRGFEIAIKEFLHLKKAILSTPVGSGINFIFPILERSRSVFIETEESFPNESQRLQDLRARLDKYNHIYTILHEGPIPIIKIDNIVYEAIPQAITVSKVPIHGVRLLPRHLA